MSKIKFLSLMTIMLMVTDVASAANEPTSLATKNYVDTGLSYVYTDVQKNATAIGDSSSGLIKDVADLQSAVNAIDVPSYSGINGIIINNNNEIGLNVTPENGKIYVFTKKNGVAVWDGMELKTSWE